jgi:hypothetical protein
MDRQAVSSVRVVRPISGMSKLMSAEDGAGSSSWITVDETRRAGIWRADLGRCGRMVIWGTQGSPRDLRSDAVKENLASNCAD